MYCSACSQPINFGARFCSHCGQAAAPQQAQQWWNPYARRIVRPRSGRMVGGVCAGIADYYGWDPVIVRLVAVALLIFTHICVFTAYIIAWVVIPNEPYMYAPPIYTPPPAAGSGPTSYAGGTGSAPIS